MKLLEFLMPVHYVVLRTWSHKQSLFNPWCGSQEDLGSFPLLGWSLAFWSWLDMVTDSLWSNIMDPKKTWHYEEYTQDQIDKVMNV